ncbi:MAG: preprotein translocase subunit SecG [Sphingomonas sp. 28-62-20]|uniref:preprotein translocase subunit SecG n=1 Tax=Sphingomonas sp. 28-62-20 TaxID=1970433 RepID=UPI000A09A405|nr:MAG: preprotein translocase subunit SecG [Proteobacteria bacterium ST_bin13]OYY78581.1 MAG: preprotein translocase subunit SecG [Sphingomonas sp. 28-62-20]
MFFTFLLVVHALVAAALVGVILMQRSEGGGLGMGGSPAGLMSARGAADFLTRATSILATLFVSLSIVLAFLAASRHAQSVDTTLARPTSAPITAPGAPAPTLGEAPSAAAVAAASEAAGSGNAAAPASNSVIPLEQ